MITALDSSVLLLVQRRERGWKVWRDLLTRSSSEGALVMCPVVFAECSIGFRSAEVALSEFASLQIRYDPFSSASAFLAGQTFLRYRREGGPREQLIPDFLVAAHACKQADRLAAIDRGYQRRYFPTLSLLQTQ